MACRVAGRLSQVGGDPAESLVACDLDTSGFAVPGLTCCHVTWAGTLPWPDGHFDVVYSIEVIEHLENPYAFAREVLRVLVPGGRLVITTPNIHNMTSRVRTLLCGYPTMFGIVTFKKGDEGDWLGHVTPIVWTTLYACLHRAGAKSIRLHVDRRKKSSIALACVAWFWTFAWVTLYRRALATGSPDRRGAAGEFDGVLRSMSSFDILTSRSLVVEAVKGES